MSCWAVGDVQGCYDEFVALLEAIEFDPREDQVWLAGDLVNRGPKSLETLRLVRSLGAAAQVVLGNHDLHLLAARWGGRTANPKDTFDEVLAAPDCDPLCHWLRQQPLLHIDPQRRLAVVHAGLPPWWSTPEQAQVHAAEVQGALRSEDFEELLNGLYGDEAQWSDELTGLARLRTIINGLTRMRVCTDSGKLDLRWQDAPLGLPPDRHPWYLLSPAEHQRWGILFGHWASLDRQVPPDCHALPLDSGCVWGGQLTALNLDTRQSTSVPAETTPRNPNHDQWLRKRAAKRHRHDP